MLEYLDSFFNQLSPLTAYVLLFVSAFVENIFPPIPGDTVTLVGAYLVASGKLSFVGVYISTTLGSVFGFFAMYIIGLKLGRKFLNSKIGKKVFTEAQYQKTEKWFSKYGYGIIIANRFLSGTRSVISIFAGSFHLNWLYVLGLSTISALLWNGLLIYIIYVVGLNWDVIRSLISQYNKIVIVITLIVASYFVIRRIRLKKSLKDV
jgi:membrane protein DedA with SNARE-associated domain